MAVPVGFVMLGLLTGAAAVHGQDTTRLVDTTRKAVDSAKKAADTTRKQLDTSRKTIDTTRKPIDSTKKSGEGAKKTVDTTRGDAATSAGSGSLRSLGKVDGPVRLAADLSERELTVIAANGALRTFKVAIGTPADPTPTGTFRIRKIVWNPSWIPPDEKWAKGQTAKGPGQAGNPMRVAKIFFREPDYYIHGTPYVNSLGSAASHGCLRMHPDEVAELAQFLMLNGGEAREEGWFSRIIHLRWKTHTVMLSQPLSLTISP